MNSFLITHKRCMAYIAASQSPAMQNSERERGQGEIRYLDSMISHQEPQGSLWGFFAGLWCLFPWWESTQTFKHHPRIVHLDCCFKELDFDNLSWLPKQWPYIHKSMEWIMSQCHFNNFHFKSGGREILGFTPLIKLFRNTKAIHWSYERSRCWARLREL